MNIILDSFYNDNENNYSITTYTIHSDGYGCFRFCALHMEETGVPGGNHGNLSDLVTTLSFHMSTPGYQTKLREANSNPLRQSEH